jgi:hypothetical protein
MGKSLRSNIDRSNLFDVPSYTKLIDTVKKINDKPWIKPACAILAATGCRVGELLYLKRGNIKFIDYYNKEIPSENLILSNVATIQFNLHTEKNRKSKHRVVPLIKNELFLDLVEIIVDYCKNIKYDDTMLFPYTRGAVWYAIKRNIGKDFFPHYIRHINATNDARAGVSPSVQQAKYGHTDLRAQSRYHHLNVLDILNEQRKAFGEPNKKEEIYNVIDATAEARKKYNQERGFVAPEVHEERAVYLEKANHPEVEPDVPLTQEDITLKKISEGIKQMPEFKDKMEEKPEAIILPIDDPTFVKEIRKYPEPRFVGPELPKQPNIKKEFNTVKPGTEHLFKEGMIVNNKVIVVESSLDKLGDIKKTYDPDKVIPVHVINKQYMARVANLRKAQQQKKNEDNQLVAVV